MAIVATGTEVARVKDGADLFHAHLTNVGESRTLRPNLSATKVAVR